MEGDFVVLQSKRFCCYLKVVLYLFLFSLFVLFPAIWKCCIPLFGTVEKIDFIFAWESTKLMTGSYELEAEGGTEQKSKQHWNVLSTN